MEIAREKQHYIRVRAWEQVRDLVAQLVVDTMMAPARVLAPAPWTHQRWATHQDFGKEVEKVALVPVLVVDFGWTSFPLRWMVEQRPYVDFLEFPAPQHSPLCGIESETPCASSLAQVAERGDEEAYRDLSGWK